MVNHQPKISKSVISTDLSKKPKRAKKSRNTKRRIRRKRNKFRYYQSLRKLRSLKKTEELCEVVESFDITDMEWSSVAGNTPAHLPVEIIEWQKRDQIAFWRSKAITLELENRMLRKHLRDMYAKTVEEYAPYYQTNQECLSNNPQESSTEISSNTVNDSDKSKLTEATTSANFPEFKNRSEELKKIYGEKGPKILGMETAIQLNYERHLDKLKPNYWPHLPLKY